MSSPADRLEVLVLGAGRAGRELRGGTFSALPDTRVSGFVDPDLAAARAAAAELGDAGAWSTLEEALSAARPDIVVVASPPQYHLAQATEALEAGVHVLLEKPMVTSLAELESLDAARRRARGALVVVHNQKFEKRYREAFRRVGDGEIGRVLTVDRAWMGSGEDDRMLGDPDHWVNQIPGGRWGETLPHDLYLAYNLIGESELLWVQASFTHRRWPWLAGDELLIGLANRTASATLRLSVAARPPYTHMTVCGTAGHLLVTDAGLRSGRQRRVHPAKELVRSARSLAAWGARSVGGRLRRRAGSATGPKVSTAHLELARRFVDHVRDGAPSPVPWEEAVATIRLTLEIAGRLPEPPAGDGEPAGSAPA